MKAIIIEKSDNVAIAIEDIAESEVIVVGDYSVTVKENIPKGHKFALRDIKNGSQIIKYGVVIGVTTHDISKGEWVHTHNIKSCLTGLTEYKYSQQTYRKKKVNAPYISGYKRKDEKIGIRNEVWIVPTVNCINNIASKLALENQDLIVEGIDGLYAFPQTNGCGQAGDDLAKTCKLLASLICHPNAGAVLVLGLGCEALTKEMLLAELGEFDQNRVKFLYCQEIDDEFIAGRAMLEECITYAMQFKRECVSMEKLVIGVKCGGSDGFSGLTANPTIGVVSDQFIEYGASVILSEIPEMFGAEQGLLNRCRSKDVFDKLVKVINNFKRSFLLNHIPIYSNPSPGNNDGGITTLEEKSCGCVKKAGGKAIVDVLSYGERIVRNGLNILETPGLDLVSVTAMAAAGAQIILFTTGRGTPLGGIVPTVKIASNSQLAQQKSRWIDIDSDIFSQKKSILDMANALNKLILEVVNGKKTKNEIMDFRDIAILKEGVTM